MAVIPTPYRNACGGVLRSIAADGRGEGSGGGSLAVRKLDPETVRVTSAARVECVGGDRLVYAAKPRFAPPRIICLPCLPPEAFRGTRPRSPRRP